MVRRSGAKRGRLGAVSSSDDPALGKPSIQEKADSSPSYVSIRLFVLFCLVGTVEP